MSSQTTQFCLCVCVCHMAGLSFGVGEESSHSPEPAEDDSRWFLGTPLSERAMMNERAPVGLTVYLDLLFLTQFPHKERVLKCLSIKT